jgi:hypothetical protein
MDIRSLFLATRRNARIASDRGMVSGFSLRITIIEEISRKAGRGRAQSAV